MFTGTADLGPRIGARLLDILIVAIPASIVLWFIGAGVGFGDSWIGSALTSLLWFGYFVYLESSRGSTIGKQILNLKVISASGAPPSTEEAAKRNVWMLFGLVPWIGGVASLVAVIVIIVTISSDNHNRGYHDTFAGTAVMRA
ncbi:MAG: RDD family protein [Egicoccus sp.]